MHEPIESLMNLGPKSGAWLRAVGIASIDDLRSIGPIDAYCLVKQNYPRASLNLLWAMDAGLRNKDWRSLTNHRKEQLRQRVNRLLP